MASSSARRPDDLTRSRPNGSENRDTVEREREERDRVDGCAARATAPHLEVQVRSARVPGVAHGAEHLITDHGGSDGEARGELIEVVVSVGITIGTLQHPRIALIAPEDLLSDEYTVDTGHHRLARLAVAATDVDALVRTRSEQTIGTEVVEQDEIAGQLHREPDVAGQPEPDRLIERNCSRIQPGCGVERSCRSSGTAQPDRADSDERSS